jgi:hypothetical protein
MISKVFQYDIKCSYEQNKNDFINQAYFERCDAIKQGFLEPEFDVKRVELRFDDLFSHKK